MNLTIKEFVLYLDQNKTSILFKTQSLTFSSGMLNVIHAPSGSGKTSFLNVLAGMNQNYEGSILLDGKTISPKDLSYSKDLSYVTSDGCSIPEITIKDQLKLVSTDEEKIQRTLSAFSLDDIQNKKIKSCSSGERERIEVASALLKDTSICILDEPTANLDDENKRAIFRILSDYAKNHLVIVVTHDSDFIENEYRSFEIRDQQILLDKVVEQESCDNTSVKDGKSTPKTIHVFPVYNKIALSMAFKSKLQYIFSVLFLAFFLFGAFFYSSLNSITQENTVTNIIEHLPNDYYVMRNSAFEKAKKTDGQYFIPTLMDATKGEPTSIPTACLEDLDKEIQKEIEPYFSAFRTSKETTDNVRYFPVVITQKQAQFFQDEKVSVSVGSEFPASLTYNLSAQSHERISDKFLVAGIIDKETDSPSAEEFPCVIRKQDYLSCLEDNGIRVNTISDSVAAILDKYKKYCEEQHLSCTIDTTDLGIESLIRYSSVSSLFVESNVIPEQPDGKIYYGGDKPTHENWMMFPYDGNNGAILKAYRVLHAYEMESRADKSFFEPYMKDDVIEIPLVDSYQGLDLKNQASFVAAGSYYFNSSTSTMNDCVIVSDSLFDKLIQSISPLHKDRTTNSSVYVTKAFLKDNHSLLEKDEKENSALFSFSWSSYLSSLTSVFQMKKFILIVTIVFSVIALVFSFVYVVNIRDQFTVDFAVLDLLGKNEGQRIVLLLLSLIPFLLLSYCISLGCSQPISSLIILNLSRQWGFTGSLMTKGYTIPYLIQLAGLFLFFLISFAFSFIQKKKKAVQQIKAKD